MKNEIDLLDSLRLPSSFLTEGFPPAKSKGKKPFPPKKNEAAKAPGKDEEEKPMKGFPSGQAPESDSSVEIFQLQQQDKKEKEDAFKKEQEKINKEEEKERKVAQQLRLKAEKEVADDLDGKYNEDEDTVTMYPELNSFAHHMDEEDEDAEDGDEEKKSGDVSDDKDDDQESEDDENDEVEDESEEDDEDVADDKKPAKKKKKVVKETKKKKKSLKEHREILAKQVKAGDWMVNGNTGERMAKVERVDQARASGYLVFSLTDIQPRYKQSFPNGQTSMHKGNTFLVEAFDPSLKRAVSQIYGEIAPDVWGDETPDDDEFLDVMLDRVGDALGKSLRETYKKLSDKEKRELILSVGP